MYRIILMSAIGLLSLSSCNKEGKICENYICDVQNPIEEVTWLRDAIEESKNEKYSYYSMGTFRGETVFFFDSCDPLINYASILTDCNGNTHGWKNDFLDELVDVKIVWKHEETLCDI